MSKSLDNLIQFSNLDTKTILENLNTSFKGLSYREHIKRLKQYGPNEIEKEKRNNWIVRLFKTMTNPLIILLLFLILVSVLTKDTSTSIVIAVMVFISVALRFFQETQAYNSAESLKSMVKTTCTVIRDEKSRETDLKHIVPGDIIELSAGDIIPADLRILNSKELFINQSILTGESLPVDKHADVRGRKENANPLESKNLCFMGTNVESGHAYAVVLQTGTRTYFGSLAKTIEGERVLTSFDKGIANFTWLMLAFMAVMVPMVFVINGLSKGNWFEAFLFSISIAVGLTPTMLPAIVTVNLSKGALIMSKKKVIVKRLNAIQNFGAMNILCTDKTGTLTLNKIVLIDNIDITGKTNLNVLHFAFINSFFQTGFRNLLDTTVIHHGRNNQINNIESQYIKIDELPFDFKRKRVSVVVENKGKERIIICKGALEEVLEICSSYDQNNSTHPLNQTVFLKIKTMNDKFNEDGFRVLAVAYKKIKESYDKNKTPEYEQGLIFSGLMTFFDPPKESAAHAIKTLGIYGIETKILTGDNELVTKKIASEVRINVKGILLGNEIESMSDETLTEKAKNTTIFAKLTPEHKRRIIAALKKAGYVVGFLGDGINDAPGLRTADVGISVDHAVDIAKESADMILLEMSLNVLADGVAEGRKVFGNIMKYIKMGASSNFGNMFSVLGASLFLPFLPMTALQILVNNLLYDFSQTAIPLDNVDKEYVEVPRKWQINDIGRFILCIGPISSLFDYSTFFIMLYVFHAWQNPSLFQTGWFIESLATQTLIVHVIRSKKIPFFQTWASKSMVAMTVLIVAIGILVVESPFGKYFSFVKLPPLYWPLLVLTLISYILLTQLIKSLYIRKFGYQ